jgi:Magnesium chelatase, subunit ChlI
MLARRLATILPAMSLAAARETTRIPRIAGLTGGRAAVVTTRPFRASHHTISEPTVAAIEEPSLVPRSSTAASDGLPSAKTRQVDHAPHPCYSHATSRHLSGSDEDRVT